MPKATSPLAVLAVFASLTAAPPVLAAPDQNGAQPRTRTCVGETLTVAWGRAAFDADGPCRPASAAGATTASVAALRSRVVATSARSCPNRRTYLGGAIVICDDAPRAETPR